jgi:predicted ferric reductase
MVMSRLFALLSLGLFVAALISSLRIRFVVNGIGGLARLYRLHHKIGLAAGIFILCHVGWELLSLPWSMARGLIFSNDPALLLAWVAVILFGIALFLSYKRNLRYSKWYFLHLLFPLSLVLAIFHAYQFRWQEPLDEALILSLGVLSGIVLMILVIGKFWNPKASGFKVKEIKQHSVNIWELQLVPQQPGTSLEKFRAGDIIYMRFLQEGFTHQLHPFSVASCRFEPTLRLYIKSLGKDTSHLQDLRLDADVQVLGPFAELRPDPARPQIWVAGGIGMAPYVGFLYCMGFEPYSKPVRVLHFISSKADQFTEAQQLLDQQTQPGLVTWQTLLTENNRLDFSPLDAAIRELGQPLILVCGPNPFMKAIREHVASLGIPKQDIKTEEFVL